jgi:hypothetical protein
MNDLDDEPPVGYRFISLYTVMKDEAARQDYETPIKKSIPVIYQGKIIASADLDGFKYIYKLPPEVEGEVVAGRIESSLGRDLISFKEGVKLHTKFRIVAIDLRNKEF